MTKVPASRKKFWFLGTIATVVVFVGGAYLATLLGLPPLVNSAYQNRDCAQTIKYTDLYARVGGKPAANETGRLKQECQLYQQVQELEQQKKWQAAFEGNQQFIRDYPQGVMASDAAEHSYSVLIDLATERISQQNFAGAIHILEKAAALPGSKLDYGDPMELISVAYIGWANSLRNAGDFSAAEAKLIEMQAWSQKENRPESLGLAQTELVRTSLDWGAALENSGKLYDASLMYKHAIELAPQSEASKLAMEHLVGLYSRRGDALIERREYELGLDQYNFGLDFASDSDKMRLGDAMINIYLEWAKMYSERGDFATALLKNGAAARINGSPEGRKTAQSAEQELIKTFSNSSGKQAQNAINSAVKAICARSEKPALPIFGIDAEHRQAAFDGLELKFSPELLATTPASAHFAVCISERAVLLESKQIRVIYSRLRISGGTPWWNPQRVRYDTTNSGSRLFTRTQFFWDVTVYDLTSGKQVGKKTFDGTVPEKLLFAGYSVTVQGTSNVTYNGITVESKAGDKPIVAIVNTWLLGLIK